MFACSKALQSFKLIVNTQGPRVKNLGDEFTRYGSVKDSDFIYTFKNKSLSRVGPNNTDTLLHKSY